VEVALGGLSPILAIHQEERGNPFTTGGCSKGDGVLPRRAQCGKGWVDIWFQPASWTGWKSGDHLPEQLRVVMPTPCAAGGNSMPVPEAVGCLAP